MFEKIFLWSLKKLRPNSHVIYAMMKQLRKWHGLCNIDTMWEVVKNEY